MGENGWNRSGGNTRSGSNANRCPVKRIAFAVAAMLLAGVGAWFLWPSAENADEAIPTPKKPAQIKEAKPATVSKAENPAPESPKPVDPNARPTKVGEMVNGYVMLPSGRIHRRIGAVTNSIAGRPKPHYHIFKHRTDNEIASYLSLQPGDVIVGTRRYTGNFARQFMESLKDPIEVAPDDTPEQARLKRDVAAARQQLKEAYYRGEDIEQMMIATRNELQDLMRVKNSMRKLFNEEAAKCRTEEDVDVMLQACNKMLAEKGVAPLKCGTLAKMNILRNNADANDGGPEEPQQPTEGSTK